MFTLTSQEYNILHRSTSTSPSQQNQPFPSESMRNWKIPKELLKDARGRSQRKEGEGESRFCVWEISFSAGLEWVRKPSWRKLTWGHSHHITPVSLSSLSYCHHHCHHHLHHHCHHQHNQKSSSSSSQDTIQVFIVVVLVHCLHHHCAGGPLKHIN